MIGKYSKFMFNLVKNIQMAEQNTSGQITTVKKEHPIKIFFKRLLYTFFVLFILSGIGAFFYWNSSSEEGYSAGLLINFSKKGLFFKTYEGTLNSGSVTATGGSNTSNNTWNFSVKDEKVAEELNGIMKSSNKNVSLHYKEKRGKFFWQGETNRFVDGVDEVK